MSVEDVDLVGSAVVETRDDRVHVAGQVLLSARVVVAVAEVERARIVLAAEPLHVVHHEDAKHSIVVGRGIHEPVAACRDLGGAIGLLASGCGEHEHETRAFHVEDPPVGRG